MDSLPKEMLLKIIGQVKLEDLPSEVLIHMIHERDAKISHYQTFEEKHNNLLKKFQTLNSEHSELQEQHDLLEKLYEDRNIEIKQLKDEIKELQQDVRQRSEEDIYGDNLPHQNGKYLYMNRIQADFDFSKISEKELKKIKKKNLLDFMNEKCQFTSVLIDNTYALGNHCELQAYSPCREIWREYRNFMV